MNKKVVYLSIFLILTLFLISACQYKENPKIPQCINCAPPPEGCEYVGGSCETCGKLVCEKTNEPINKEQTCLPLNTKLANRYVWECTKFYTNDECKQIHDILKNIHVKELSQNFNNDNSNKSRINIIFTGYEYTSEDKFKNLVSQISGVDEIGQVKNEGFFTINPFNNYKSRFNIWYAFVPNTKFDLVPGVRDEIRERFDNKYIMLAELINGPYGQAGSLFGKDVGGGAARGSDYLWINVPEDATESSYELKSIIKHIFPHEFGHLFGLMGEEYLSEIQGFLDMGMPPDINCDVADNNKACIKWCTGKPRLVEDLKNIRCDVDSREDLGVVCGNKINSGLPCSCAGCQTKIGSSSVVKQCINVVSYCTDLQTKSECEDGIYKDLCKWNGGSDANNFQPVLDPYFNSFCVPIDISRVDIGTNCLEGTGCYQQCNYINSYRSSLDSIMRTGNEYSRYQKNILESCLIKLTQ